MGILSNLWHGKNHEMFDQIAANLAADMADYIRDLRAEGMDTQQATAQAVDQAARVIRQFQDENGLNIWGYGRIMLSLENAFVMMGMRRESAKKIKAMIRERAPALRVAR